MSKLKVAHYVCFDKKFIPQQIAFLNKNFSEEIEQTFYLHGAPESYLNDAPDNVVSISKAELLKFVVAAHMADRIVFNGLFYRKIILLFALMPWLLGKAIWLPWGADLYWRLYGRDTAVKAIFLAVKGWFVRHLYAIATPTFGDYETAINWYGKGPIYINAGCNIFNFEQSDLDYLSDQKIRNVGYRIQIGNSSDPTNDHLGAMELLSHFAEENILVYIPLSYGNPEYAERVIENGKIIFGEKFIPLTQFMSPAEYNKHLATVDVLILNHRRQQGFGNVVISLYLGAKVFIRREVSVWSYLTEVMGCAINATDRIYEMSFQQFCENKPGTVQQNRSAVAHLFSRAWQRENWSRLYFD